MAKVTVYSLKGMKALVGESVEGLKVGLSKDVDNVLNRLHELDEIAKKEDLELSDMREARELLDRLHSLDIVVDENTEFRETEEGVELLLGRNEKIDLVVNDNVMRGEGGEEAKDIYRDLLRGDRLAKPRPSEKVEPFTPEQMAKARKWIANIRSLAKTATTFLGGDDILAFADAVERFIESDYSGADVKAFKKALKRARVVDVLVKSPLLSFDTVETVFPYAVTNLFNLVIGAPKDDFSSFRETEEQKFRDVIDLDDEAELLLKRKRRSVFEERRKDLDSFLEDRVVADKDDFESIRHKKSGFMTGIIVAKKTDQDGHPFMLKKVEKNFNPYGGDIRRSLEDRRRERREFINEYIVAPLYKRTLYDRAPIISLVDRDESKNLGDGEMGSIYLRSKFLHDFQTVGQYAGFVGVSQERGAVEDFAKLRQVEGAEKVFASALFWGEVDFNLGNVGVMKVEGEEGEEKVVFAKIDHGMSASSYYTSPNKALSVFKERYTQLGYRRVDPEDDRLSPNYEMATQLNVRKLKEAIDQILLVGEVGETGVTIEDEMKTIVEARIFQLKHNGVEIEGQSFRIYEDGSPKSIKMELNEDEKRKLGEIEDSSERLKERKEMIFKKLGKFYIERFRKQIQVIRELSKKLEIISKINFSPISDKQTAWENGGWFEGVSGGEYYVSIVDDPIEWARRNDKTIDGLAPDQFEYEFWRAQQRSDEGREVVGLKRL